MSRLGSWLGSKAPSANVSTKSLAAAEEPKQLEEAMVAAMHIMNDDMDLAEKSLEKGDSSYHVLGRGIVTFLRAIIGSEQEAMKEASSRLADAETVANENKRRAEKDTNTFRSEIYPPGTEHALCCAEAQIMAAGVGVLNESVTEALKGFYKMRKAYLTLDAIAATEKQYLDAHRSTINASRTSLASHTSPTSNGRLASAKQENVDKADDEEFDEFYDADDANHAATKTEEYLGHLEKDNRVYDKSQTDSLQASAEPALTARPLKAPEEEDEAAKALITHPIDVFIHSGTSLHYGIIQLMLSLIPPAFSKLLSLIGFRGDRQRGLALLWRATSVRSNINGCIAALVLLGYYNGLVSFLDILPQGAYPKARCDSLLNDMRQAYPKSRFWYLQEARTYAAEKDLERAVAMLEAVESEECKLRQVEALQWFEKSLDLMYLHEFERCAAAFLRCRELNNWSHGLYFYCTAASHIELYRIHSCSNASSSTLIKGIVPDASKAPHHAAEATRFLVENVPNHMGKKKLIGRQLPFDTFVMRKLAKWHARSKALGVPLVDAVGVSPLEEMIFVWGGYGRMHEKQLRDSLARLAWSDGGRGDILPGQTHTHEEAKSWASEPKDERGLLALLRGTIYRHLKQPGLAREILERDVVAAEHKQEDFRGNNRENWVPPLARYEAAVALWVEAGGATGSDALICEEMDSGAEKTYDREKLKECAKLLEQAAGWDSYDLDARMGIKMTTGRETLRGLGI